MSGRLPACEQPGIAERMREIQAERMAAIAGCSCPQRTAAGEIVHTPLCPLRSGAPPAAQLREVMQRARERLQPRLCLPAPLRRIEP